MKKILLIVALILILLPSLAMAEDLHFNWDANTETDIAGYTIHYGTESGVYTTSVPVGSGTDFMLTLNAGTYYITMTATDTNGNVSDYSYEIKKVVKVGPVSGWGIQ